MAKMSGTVCNQGTGEVTVVRMRDARQDILAESWSGF